MASMWSVAKFLTLSTRARTSVGETVKTPSTPPLPAPAASEVPKSSPEPSPPSRTQSRVDVAPSKRDEPTWPAETALVHEPEETQSLETMVESKASSKRQGSASPSLHNGIDLPTSNPWLDAVESPKVEVDDSEKVLETSDITSAETLSDKESPTVDNTAPAYTEPQEPKPELIRKYEIDLAAALLEKKRFADESRRLQVKLRTALDAVDEKTKAIKQLSERTRREMEVRRACEESEEAAKKETQRVKVMIAVERHAHSERVKEKEELIAAAQSNVESQKERIGVLEGRLEDETREVVRLREDIKAVTLGKEEAIVRAETERVEMEERWKIEMEGVRHACRDNEEAARKETQRVKGLIGIERHSHNEQVKKFEEEKHELVEALDIAKKETQRIKGLIAVERHTHSERMKEFKDEKDELVAALDIAKKETQRIKGLIAVERHTHSERMKESKDEKDEFAAALDTARKETQRVKGLIAVERHSHSEQVRESKEEKDELSAVLAATRSAVLASATQIESQKEEIRSLEGRLEDTRTATQKVLDKYRDQESTTKRLQEEMVEERNKVLTQVEPLKLKLVEMHSKARKTEQENRLLREQVSQLQNPVAAVGRFVSSIWS